MYFLNPAFAVLIRNFGIQWNLQILKRENFYKVILHYIYLLLFSLQWFQPSNDFP